MADDVDPPGELTRTEEVVDYDDAVTAEVDSGTRHGRQAPSPLLTAFIAGVVVVLALGGLAGWLGYRAHASHQAKTEREQFLTVARQGALNLTTIDYRHAGDDIKRILDSASGQFQADFSQRSQPFVDVVEKAKSSSEGTITEAGLESSTATEGHALVAVSVKTSIEGAPPQEPRSWRMKLTVQRSGDDYTISNVGFVP